jgi:cytochrome c peroxidase
MPRPQIARHKLRAAIRKLGDEYVFSMLDEVSRRLTETAPERHDARAQGCNYEPQEFAMKTRLASLLFVTLALGAGRSGADDRHLKLPAGLDEQEAVLPADNPMTAEKIALGKKLFWDKRWSTSGTVACVSCHPPDHGWSDPRQFSTNFAGKPTARHAPTLVNRLFSERQLWTGLRGSLEEQATNDSNRTVEMIMERLGSIPAYREEFRKVFGRDFDADGVGKAIATYVRTIVSGNSPYDRFQGGNRRAMSAAAQRGLALFKGKALCSSCHSGFNFTDEAYHNIGVGMDKAEPDLGRYVVSKIDGERGAFKTPTLRDVARRGPYMHDGSEKTLAGVVAYYNRGGVSNQWLSSNIKPLGLSASEQVDLIEFLKALTGTIDPEVSRPPDLPK